MRITSYPRFEPDNPGDGAVFVVEPDDPEALILVDHDDAEAEPPKQRIVFARIEYVGRATYTVPPGGDDELA